MITGDGPGLKRWRAAVRRRVKASPELRRERRRTRTRTPALRSWSTLRFAVPLAIALAISAGVPTGLLANWLLLWSTLVTLARAQQIAVLARDPNTLWPWYGWPVTDDEVYAHQRGVALRSSAWLGVDWLVFGLALAWQAGEVTLAVAAPVVAAGQWAASLALALWVVRWRPQFPFGRFVVPAGGLVFLAVRFGQGSSQAAHPYVEGLLAGLYAGTPAGWLSQGLAFLADGNPLGWPLLLGVGAIAGAALVSGARAFRKVFSPDALFGYETAPAASEADEADSDHASSDTERSPEAEPAAHRETAPVNIASLRAHLSDVLNAPAGQALTARGPVEHALGWLLDARQRALVDFMVPGGMPWMRRWVLAIALLAILPIVRAHNPGWAAGPAFIALAFALPVAGGRWLGFEALRSFQTQIGLTSLVPAGFWEISRLVLMLNALYCVAAFPLVLAIVWLGFAPEGASTWWALDYGARVVGVVIALQPVWLAARFSANTNDTSAGRIFLLGMVVLIIVGLMVGVSLCVTVMMAETPAVALSCLGVLLLLTHAALGAYGWAWGRGWFDLIAKPK